MGKMVTRNSVVTDILIENIYTFSLKYCQKRYFSLIYAMETDIYDVRITGVGIPSFSCFELRKRRDFQEYGHPTF